MPKTIDVWVKIDSEGDYAIGETREDAIAGYASQWASDLPFRMYRTTLTVEAPADVAVTAGRLFAE